MGPQKIGSPGPGNGTDAEQTAAALNDGANKLFRSRLIEALGTSVGADPAPGRVFLSYSSKDKQWADAACTVLESKGIRCWVAPRDIAPGTEWGAAIVAGIDACSAMVLIFSQNANRSPQVRREVERAVSKGLTIVPCRVENTLPEGAMEYALSNTHWLDAFTPPMESQLLRLADAVWGVLTPAAAQPRSRAGMARRLGGGPAGVNRNGRRTWVIIGAAVAGLILICALVLPRLMTGANKRQADGSSGGSKLPVEATAGVNKDPSLPLAAGKAEPPAPESRAVKGTVTFKDGRTRTFLTLGGLDTTAGKDIPTPTVLFLKSSSGPHAEIQDEVRIPFAALKAMTIGPKWINIEPYYNFVSVELELKNGKKQVLPTCIGCLDIEWADDIGVHRYMLHSGVDVFLGARFAFD